MSQPPSLALLPKESVDELIERFGISYQLAGVRHLRLPTQGLIPSQVLPFEVLVNDQTPLHLPPREIETKITNDSDWKRLEIPILMELSRLFGHPSTHATLELRTRIWEFDDHQVIYETSPALGTHTLRIEIHREVFDQLIANAEAESKRVRELELDTTHLSFEYESFHRWLEETLQPPTDPARVYASKSGTQWALSTPKGYLPISPEAQLSIILRDYGDREDVVGFSLYITLKNPLGGFPAFVEASFCTCQKEHLDALEKIGTLLAEFWGIPLRREVSVARY